MHRFSPFFFKYRRDMLVSLVSAVAVTTVHAIHKAPSYYDLFKKQDDNALDVKKETPKINGNSPTSS